MTWHPRGTPSWPGWRHALPGQRVRHVRSGRLGTVVRVLHGGVRVVWDGAPGAGAVVVAPAFDLAPLPAE